MTDSPLRVESADGVTRLILDRPDKRNALSAELVEALLEVVESPPAGTRLLVIQGAGKAFCAGFDFGDLDNQSDGDLVHRFVRLEQLLQAIHHAPCTTLALAHGACFGAGADIFAVCHRRVAAPGTRFRMPGLQFGVMLGTRRLAELVGADHARAVLETSRIFSAEEGKDMGIVQRLAAEDEWPALETEASEAASVLAPGDLAALHDATTSDFRDADLADLVRSVAAPGLRERIRAFLATGR